MDKVSINSLVNKNVQIIIYGYGYNGMALEKLLVSFGSSDYKIVDDKNDNERFSKIEDLLHSIEAVVLISISDSNISDFIKNRCLSFGFHNIHLISEFDFRKELLDMGFRKASSGVKYEHDCPICDSDSSQYFINMYEYELVKCVNCEHIYVKNMNDINPINFYEDNMDYYRNIFYDGLENFKSDNFLEPDSYILNRLELINSFLSTHVEEDRRANFLELGCLDGRLLFYLKQLGLNVYGCEVNRPVAQYAQQILGISIQTDELSNCKFENDFFDYIFSSHVLEHLKYPVEEMKLMAKLLKTGGRSIHHLPCGEDDYENSHHLHFFSKKSIIELHMRLFGNVEHFTTLAQRGDGSVYDVITTMSIKKGD